MSIDYILIVVLMHRQRVENKYSNDSTLDLIHILSFDLAGGSGGVE